MKLMSKAFRYGEVIPDRYTMDGENMSPPLEWEGEPCDTRSFAMIVDECDVAGGIENHWVMYNIPPSSHFLSEDAPHTMRILQGDATGARNGINDLFHWGYEGPHDCDSPHRYNFKLFALDSMLQLPRDATRNCLKKAMKRHILAEANLMGVYPA